MHNSHTLRGGYMPAVEEKLALTGDQLILYGFKRLSGQLLELIDEIHQINGKLDQIEQANNSLKTAVSKLDKIENHLFTMVGIQLAMQEKLDQTRADTYTTALNVIQIEQAMKQGDSDNDESEDV